MKKIAVGTLKGGTGKTSIAFNMAGELALKNKVLLIDMDPQCNLSNNAGVDISQQDIYSTKDIFENDGREYSPEKLIIKEPVPELPNMDIIPGHILLTATELRIGAKAARERILEYYFEDYAEYFAKYDYIIMDTNPSMGVVNQNAFCAADSIILVTDIDDNSRIGLQLFIYLWEEVRKALRKEDNIKALVVNKVDVRTNLTSALMDYFREDEELSKILVKQPVKSRVAFQYAALEKVPVCLYKNGQESAEEIRNIVKELKKRGIL